MFQEIRDCGPTKVKYKIINRELKEMKLLNREDALCAVTCATRSEYKLLRCGECTYKNKGFSLSREC
jgi:hypothetical protein